MITSRLAHVLSVSGRSRGMILAFAVLFAPASALGMNLNLSLGEWSENRAEYEVAQQIAALGQSLPRGLKPKHIPLRAAKKTKKHLKSLGTFLRSPTQLQRSVLGADSWSLPLRC